jgi:hypothetical protein
MTVRGLAKRMPEDTEVSENQQRLCHAASATDSYIDTHPVNRVPRPAITKRTALFNAVDRKYLLNKRSCLTDGIQQLLTFGLICFLAVTHHKRLVIRRPYPDDAIHIIRRRISKLGCPRLRHRGVRRRHSNQRLHLRRASTEASPKCAAASANGLQCRGRLNS